ncbi:hypothetical protein [Actinacidiphila sp. bgisy167]|uniref:hypothetical protein n=1 Tax=Actinacidiphila sp. bgisy167 TaxID=3413797 RepID=UPI003D7136E4
MTSEATVATSTHHIGVFASDHDADRTRRRPARRDTPAYKTRHRPGHFAYRARRAYRAFVSEPDGNDTAAVLKEVAP